MKHYLQNHATHHLLSLAFIASLALPLPLQAASVALATKPLVTATTSSVRPNVMFILDDSGSMGWNYLPDWANDQHPDTGDKYNDMVELFTNNGFNGVAYNPATTYTPPAFFNADGSLNTTTYPNVPAPWTSVANDAYGVQSTGSSNLVGNSSFYTFVPGEYCSTIKMKQCVAATAPTTVSGVLYDKPAGVRWCDSAALTNCQSINNTTYEFPRYPGLVIGASSAGGATATIKVTGGGSATSIKVNGFEILARPVSNRRTRSLAKDIRDEINRCTSSIRNNCTISGYSASIQNRTTITITAPLSLGAITYTPADSGSMNTVVTAFTGGSSGGGNVVPGSNLRTNIVSSTTSYPYPGTASKALTRTDCAASTCTYTEEMTNYANWWTYYHTRLQAMKTSVSRAFKTIDSKFRVGFSTISYKGATNGAKFLGNDTFELAHKNEWFTKLFATYTTGSTPLRGALSKAGRYYGNKVTNQVDPVQYSCQQNFTILSTDGYWNTGGESGDYKALDLAGNLVGNMDGGTTKLPQKEGNTPVSNTLADIAKYYYDTDLRDSSSFGNCVGGISDDFPAANRNPDVCTNNVFTSPADNNLQQHMTTFTMGLGIDGTFSYTSDYQSATSGDYYNLLNALGSPAVTWPDPINNSRGERIDDLWHAAVNGNGTYFSAKSPDEIIAGFNRTLSSITAKLGAAAAAATSTLNPIDGNNFAYVASYTTVKWTGNLESRTINTNTGVVSETASWCVENLTAGTCPVPGTIEIDTNGSSTVYNCVKSGATAATCTSPGIFDSATSECKTEIPNACTGTLPTMVGPTTSGTCASNANCDTRTIYTAKGSPLALVPFNSTNVTFSVTDISGLNQWGAFSLAQQTAAATNMVNFLRGQKGYEDRGSNLLADRLYRAREAILGDALESQPAFISKPVFKYPDYKGYDAFKIAQASRAGTVFMGTNDGMMHAFATADGIERWAYVPSMVIPNMWKLASTAYSGNHVNFVNGSPIIGDVCVSACGGSSAVWKTILVSGLNAGGRGYFALDITDPSSPALLWEFTTTAGIGNVKDDDLGYSFGTPSITKDANGNWIVLVTSGYNNTSPGDGTGYLYVLNAATGVIISKISTGAGSLTTPSGLAKIAAWNNNSSGNEAGFVYGGDLLGNVWRFDINSSAVSASIGTGDVMKFAELYSDTAGTNPQPITTVPVLGRIERKRAIFIGTGKFLETNDILDKQVQTQYGIMDDNVTATFVNPRNILVNQTLISDPNGTATRIPPSSPNTVTWDTDHGWYVDFKFPAPPDDGIKGERVNIDSKLVLGLLIVPTIVPENTICSPGGFGWLNYFDYKTGVGSSEKYDSSIVGVNIIYIKGEPVVEVVTADNPDPKIPKFKPPFDPATAKFSSQRMIWRELTP